MPKRTSIVKIAREGGITLGGNIFENVLRFIFLIAVTRVVTQTTYGQFALAVSIILFSYQIVDFNMANAVDYFIPEHLNQGEIDLAKSALRRGIVLGLITTFFGALIIAVLAPFLSSIFNEASLAYSLLLLSITIPVLGLFRIFLAAFASIKELKYRTYTQNILRPSIKLIFAVGLVFILDDLTALLIGFTTAVFISTIAAGYLLYRAAPELIGFSDNQISYVSMASYAWPLVFSGMVYAAIGQIDLFAIGYFLSPIGVGEYKVGFALASTLSIFLSSLRRIHKPIVAENKSNDEQLQFYYQLITRWGILLLIPPALSLLFASRTYLSILFTPEYASAGAVVSILVVRYLFLASFGPQAKTLEGIGYTRLILINSVIILTLNVILDIALIPVFGIAGAAVGTTIATVIGSIAGIVELSYFRNLRPVGWEHLRLWVSAIFTAIVGYIITQTISGILLAIILPSVVVLVNIIILRLTNSFTQEDRKVARQIDDALGYRIAQTITGY